MARWLIAAGIAALAGCAPMEPPSSGSADGLASIQYETGPCFGFCPVYKIDIASDGSGTFTGIRHTAVEGERAFTATPAQFDAFRAALAPYRPESGEVRYEPGSAKCPRTITDQPSVDIRWMGEQGTQHLYYYYGCAPQGSREMAEALRNAPDALPVEEWIGERPGL